MTVDIATETLSEHAVVIAPAGELDLYVAPELKQHLLGAIAAGARLVVVDLSQVTFVDSTTLGVLIGGVRRLRAGDGRLSVVISDPSILRTFELSGLDRVFAIHSTREQAVAELDDGVGVAAA